MPPIFIIPEESITVKYILYKNRKDILLWFDKRCPVWYT